MYRSIAQRNDDLPACCEETMHRKIVAPMVAADIAPYQSMATGEYITSRAHHREHLKRHRLIEVGNEQLKAKPLEVPSPAARKKMIAEIVAAKK